ncbi:MAG: hypothetical protein ACLU1U_03500 [Lachnospiraceae bacterium]
MVIKAAVATTTALTHTSPKETAVFLASLFKDFISKPKSTSGIAMHTSTEATVSTSDLS